MAPNHNPLTKNAVAYSWHQLSIRAGTTEVGAPFENDRCHADISFHYGHPEELSLTSPCVVVRPCTSDAWRDLLVSEPQSLAWVPVKEATPRGGQLLDRESVPVLFPGRGSGAHQPFARVMNNGALIFYTDIVATTFFMLSRWEETVVTTRDEHGRFPAQASMAYKQGFLDRPIVDEYALILREWLQVLLPRWEPKERSFAVQFSHDVDHIRRFPDAATFLRYAGGDVFKRRSIPLACQTVSDAAAQILSPERTSYVQGIRFLADLSRKNGLTNDVFYFMADGPGPFGGGYDPARPLVKRCIEDLQRQGFEIGLHASYDAFDDPERLAQEKTHLEASVGQPVRAVRQHYLRFRVPDTWRHFEHTGLTRDSTMAYADHEGFRCGTCHPFHPFDLDHDRELDVLEIPLVAMDSTLAGYRGLSPVEGKRRILQLARRCQEVEGTFTLVWHNSTLSRDWLSWAEIYRETVKELARRQQSAVDQCHG